jgi:hypothetical protein
MPVCALWSCQPAMYSYVVARVLESIISFISTRWCAVQDEHETWCAAARIQVFYTGAVNRTGELWYTGSVRPDRFSSTGKPEEFKSRAPVYWFSSTGKREEFKSQFKSLVQSVQIGVPIENRSLNWKKIRKFSKNIARCIEFNGVKRFQILVHLVFLRIWEVQPANFFSLFSWTSNVHKVY